MAKITVNWEYKITVTVVVLGFNFTFNNISVILYTIPGQAAIKQFRASLGDFVAYGIYNMGQKFHSSACNYE